MNYYCFIDNLVQKFLNNFMENVLHFLGELQNNNNTVTACSLQH
jgi:hypothetical protein